MFAAASNNGPHDPWYPIAFPARLDGHVFCINAADANGSRTPTNPPVQYSADNFSILGEGVEWIWPVGCENTQRKSGTSVATPIAAGIAAMILQFARENMPGDLWRLKNFYGMRLVLREMVQEVDGYRLIVPWKLLDLGEPGLISSEISRSLRRR